MQYLCHIKALNIVKYEFGLQILMNVLWEFMCVILMIKHVVMNLAVIHV